MLAAGKVNPEYIVRQRNLTKEHIDKIMDMKNPSYTCERDFL